MSFRYFVSLGQRFIRCPQLKQRVMLGAGTCLTAAGLVYSTVFANEQPNTFVYAWGYGGFGQLGLQDENDSYTPTQIQALSQKKVKKVEAGKSTSIALSSNGEVYSWGKNKGGLLGHQDSSSFNMNQPENIENLLGVKIRQVSCGQFHMAAVSEEGELFTWGNKEFGKLGQEEVQQDLKVKIRRGNQQQDSQKDSILPKKVDAMSGQKCVQVACGGQFTVVLTQSGNVYTFGQNQKGCLGYVSEQKDVYIPQLVSEINNVIKISSGHDFCAAITSNGKLYTWGDNQSGQLGNSQNLQETKPTLVTGFGSQNKIVDVSCGDSFIAALTDSGQIYMWGYGSDGQLGHANKSDLFAPMHLEFKQKVRKVACGGSHTAFITEDNQLYLFGRGNEGQLGIGQNISSETSFKQVPNLVQYFKGMKVIDVACGGEHTIAITKA